MDASTLNGDKGKPPLREWELDNHSTRYEKNLAAPSDEELVGYWASWAAIALAAGWFTFVIFLGVATSRKARTQSFNVYLIYLMIPDFTFSLLCGTTCMLNAINGEYWSHWMCNFQQWYCVWGIGSNCWLNALITHQLHILLKSGRDFRRYQMPTPQRVTCQALAVYVYCAFLGTWGLIDKEAFPYYSLQISGLACIPVEANKKSSLFFWLFFMPLFSLIPIVYVGYVTIAIWWRQLLPPTGKRRLLAIYFGRIVLIFLLLWGPYFMLNYILATFVPTWVLFAGGTFSHLQGPLSAGVSLLKPDIWFAVQRFVTCHCLDRDSEITDSSAFDHNNFSSEEESSGRSGAFWLARCVRNHSRRFFRLNRMQADSRNSSGAVCYSSVWPNEDGSYSGSDGEQNELDPLGRQEVSEQMSGRSAETNTHGDAGEVAESGGCVENSKETSTCAG